jgi:hypothetical protein
MICGVFNNYDLANSGMQFKIKNYQEKKEQY